MRGHYNPGAVPAPGLVKPDYDVDARRMPGLWRDILGRSSLERHPAELVWVSRRAAGSENAQAVFAGNPDIEHREPPVPCAWAMFERPLVFGVYHHDGGGEQPMLLRSMEWSHRDDGVVLITGYVMRTDSVGRAEPGVVITAATREGMRGLVLAGEAAVIGPGTLVTGGPVPAPLGGGTPGVPRKAQRMLAQVAHRVWQQWESPRGALSAGRVFLAEDVSASADSEPPSRSSQSSHGVRVLVVSRRGETFPNLGEVAPWGRPRTEPDHRWPVRGHYRNQPCGPGGRHRRKIWIPEHVSGPPGKPVRDVPAVLAIR